MVWKDFSDGSFKVAPRINASLTAVPKEFITSVEMSSGGPPSEGQLYLFGGDDGKNPIRDIWVYDLASDVWEEPAFQGESPTARSRHTCTLVRFDRDESQREEDRLYIFGGVGQHTEVTWCHIAILIGHQRGQRARLRAYSHPIHEEGLTLCRRLGW